MQKIMITGSSGFLAQHVIPMFDEVVGVDKRPQRYHSQTFIQADVRDLNIRDLMGVDAVIHLAWRTNIPDCDLHPRESTHDNINMTVHLLEVCKQAGVKKFLFPSTASLYSHNPTPWTEDMTAKPIEYYSWQKLACEELVKMSPIPSVIPRFFQVFGEYQREDTALAAFFRFKKEGTPITLTKTMAQSKFRSGQRDFIYAGDVATAVKLLMEKDTPSGEIYNVATGKVHTMEEVANAVGGKVVWVPRREYEVERHEGGISKLTSLGWQPDVDVIDWIHEV